MVAGITPFNLPAMIPMWMLALRWPAAMHLLKPSEKTSVPVRLAELMLEAKALKALRMWCRVTKPLLMRF